MTLNIYRSNNDLKSNDIQSLNGHIGQKMQNSLLDYLSFFINIDRRFIK